MTSSQGGGDPYSQQTNTIISLSVCWHNMKIRKNKLHVNRWRYSLNIKAEVIVYDVYIASINPHSCMRVCNFVITAQICMW